MERKYLYAIVVVLILIIVVTLITLEVSRSSGSSPLAAYDDKPVPASFMAQLTVSNNVSSAVNVTQAINNREVAPLTNTSLKASPLTINGKPEILYMGADYCPFCAAERWPLIVALLRFGNFTALKYMTSSHTDSYPDTVTFTFYNSTYTSNYIAFVSVEATANNKVNGTYPVLQVPTESENNLMGVYDAGGSIPFIDIANKSIDLGANFDPDLVLGGLNWTQVAAGLSNPSSLQAQTIISTANLLTAQICEADGNQPQSVCGQGYITKLETT